MIGDDGITPSSSITNTPHTHTTYTEMEESARADLVLEFVKSLSRYSDLLLAKLERPVER